MNPASIGELLGMCAIMIVVAAAWLIICYAIPPLRRKARVTHIVAMILTAGLAFLPVGGPTGTSIGAAMLCIAILYWQMRRVERRQVILGQAGRVA